MLGKSEIKNRIPVQLTHSHISAIKPDITDNNNFYYNSYENSGTIIITRFDTKNRILSGTFSAKLVNETDSTDIIEVANGRFDINLQTVNINKY